MSSSTTTNNNKGKPCANLAEGGDTLWKIFTGED